MKKNFLSSQRLIQTLSLAFFLWLLALAVWPPVQEEPPPDIFLRLDPLAALFLPLAQREIIASLFPGLAVLVLTLLAGRVFCGFICPLGTTLDLARYLGKLPRRLIRSREFKAVPRSSLRQIKYLALAVISGAAFLGVNLVFWGSPLALATRFYALFLQPLLRLIANTGIWLVQHPFFSGLTPESVQYLTIEPRHFDGLPFLLFFFACLFTLELFRPRFWCRYLCPAGALLGIFSFRPAQRRITHGCTHCGRCVKHCPGGAVSPGGDHTAHSECLTCRHCVHVCPGGHTSFAIQAPWKKPAVKPVAPPPLPSRRTFTALAGAGVLLAGIQYTGTHSLLRPADRIRPPGALPEKDFLIRCLRCGECMKICPTNGLQPLWLGAGPEELFSPALNPRRGPCEPECHACGGVCPTLAIRPLSLKEKQWAKIGTAVVLRQRCLAWAEDRRCVVCQEVCPYGAVKLILQEGGNIPAPIIQAERCLGCGYCEKHCPVLLSAIVVEPPGALRLSAGSYQDAAQAAGLNINPAQETFFSPEDLPPGFTD